LRQFHFATSAEPAPLDVYDKRRQAETNLIEFENLGFTSKLCGAIRDALDADLGKLVNLPLDKAMVHGDFSVDNVLKDGDRYIVLDISGKYRNSVYHDIATFLNSLSLIRLSSPLSIISLRRCVDAFLKGYFGNEPFDLRPLLFLRITGLISSSIVIARRQQHRPLVTIWIRYFISHAIRQLLRQQRNMASNP
jgi:Ser/Thr protein kinase RdoA (MazF antagonist)